MSVKPVDPTIKFHTINFTVMFNGNVDFGGDYKPTENEQGLIKCFQAVLNPNMDISFVIKLLNQFKHRDRDNWDYNVDGFEEISSVGEEVMHSLTYFEAAAVVEKYLHRGE